MSPSSLLNNDIAWSGSVRVAIKGLLPAHERHHNKKMHTGLPPGNGKEDG
jgi:hypothetical protein